MKGWSAILFYFCLFSTIVTNAQEEFSGELAGWANVKKRFGAAGDGVKDDTRAIQSAIDSLTDRNKNFNIGKNAYSVIYFPAGKYRVTSTLRLSGKIGVSLIGIDPEKVNFIWNGPENDTMLLCNGSAYFKISRFTFNANNRRRLTGIGINWKDKWNLNLSQSYASLNIEVSDCVFKGKFQRGIQGGTHFGLGTGANDSEVTIRRCSFFDMSEAGITIEGYNALDYWIWDCFFYNCYRAVQTNSGNYHIYRSYFGNTKNSVLVNTNGYYISVRNSFLDRSDKFSVDLGKSSNPFKRVFESNYFSYTLGPVIAHNHLGKISLIRNSFSDLKDKQNYYNLLYDSWANGSYEVLSLNNRYKLIKPWLINTPRNRVYSFKDSFNVKTVRDSAAFVNSMDNTPKYVKRLVFEIQPNATSDLIQSVVLKAASRKGERPIIHFPIGRYMIDSPIVFPEGSDMQLIGDGFIYSTVIEPSGSFPEGKAVFIFKGPSKVTVRDLHFECGTAGRNIDAIRFENSDQSGAEAYVDQLYSQSSHSINLLGTANIYVQNQNSFFCDGNTVLGLNSVPMPKSGTGLYSFGGSFAGLRVDTNGRFVAKDCWWEGAKRRPLDISGSGFITIDCAMVAPVGADSNTTINIGKFRGKISLSNMYVQGAVKVAPDNNQLSLLLWNINFYHKINFYDFVTGSENYRSAFLGLTTQCFDDKNPKCKDVLEIENRLIGVKEDSRFMYEMMGDYMESSPRYYRAKTSATTNAYISRVSIINFSKAITFSR